MKFSLIAAVAALGAAFAAPALAQGTATMEQRNVNQQKRIEQGVNSGQLTTKEAGRLERGQARIEKKEARAMKDGVVTPAEKARINRAQDVQSRQIYRQKHDAQTAK